MSHQEYIAGCDEDQLECLIELANAKLKTIREGGWVELFVVGTDCINYSWFDNYLEAADAIGELAKAMVSKGRSDELRLDKQRYRQEEAARLVRETKDKKKSSKTNNQGE